MKILLIFTAFVLFLGTAEMPINYYFFLRITVTIVSLLTILFVEKKTLNFWLIFFIGVAILFNPIVPIYLYQKTSWIFIDIVVGFLLVTRVMVLASMKEVRRKKIKAQ